MVSLRKKRHALKNNGNQLRGFKEQTLVILYMLFYIFIISVILYLIFDVVLTSSGHCMNVARVRGSNTTGTTHAKNVCTRSVVRPFGLKRPPNGIYYYIFIKCVTR